jgi:hypothetical protein
MSNWLASLWIWIREVLVVLDLSILCGESCLLVSWCAVEMCGMADSDEDHGRSMRPDIEDWGWSGTGRVLGGQMIERSGDTVCGLHRAQEDEEHMFIGWASKLRSTVSPSLVAKPVASGFPVWASKLASTVWWFGPQNHDDGFLVWTSNQAGYGLLVAPQNQWEEEDDTGCALRSSGLFRLEACWARVFQSSLKTSGGTTRMVHVTSSWRSRGVEAENGQVHTMDRIRLFYPNFVIFFVFGPRDILVILVFWLGL